MPAQPNAWLAAGNFFGVIPYEGRYDALQPTVFSFGKNKNAFSSGAAINTMDGEARDAKWLRWKNGQQLLVVARNNKSLKFYTAPTQP